MAEMAIREGHDADADGFIALIRACWAEYPGCVFDLDGEVPELRALATHFSAKRGALWVAEAAGNIVGMIGASPTDDGAWEMHKLYVERTRRGGGTAAALLGTAEAHARDRRATRLTLWSDTRFERAHRFYEKHSFVRTGPIRALDDKSHSIEFGFGKPIAGIEQLGAASAASAVPALARVLIACVDAGASVSFLPPLAMETACGFWSDVASGVARGEVVLFAGWADARLVGTVQLDLATPPNQPHRAEIRKMLVAPEARRNGLARALLRAAEDAALAHGRTLLTLDTTSDGAAESLYRSEDWQMVGRIPAFSLNGAGGLDATTIFYKQLAS